MTKTSTKRSSPIKVSLMGLFHNILFPKSKTSTISKPDIYKEYQPDEISRLQRIRDDADLKLKLARLDPMQREKLNHILIERRKYGKHR